MKFFRDFLITLTGLILLLSALISVFAAVGYFQGDSLGDTLEVLKFTVPIMVVSLVIGWWQRNVFWAMLNWMFPSF